MEHKTGLWISLFLWTETTFRLLGEMLYEGLCKMSPVNACGESQWIE